MIPKTTKSPTTVFLDVSKAFDKLNYDTFFSKLESYVVQEFPLHLLKVI